jgi:putative restriction endonuclease
MSFWWVNHKQTAKVEIGEGYIWSPQKNKDNSTNQAYLNLTRARLGDVIFSYAKGKIGAIGKVVTEANVEKRPLLFGSTGNQWSEDGWIVGVKWVSLRTPLIPKSHLSAIIPLLPKRFSPLRIDGNGNQKFYLVEISKELAFELYRLLDDEKPEIMWEFEDIERELQEKDEEELISNSDLSKTQREQLIQARIGQGIFRINVEKIESKCRVTGLTDKRLLIASHIKSWKDSGNDERLDGQNGFLMSPHVDKLFDRGWMSFSDRGNILISEEKVRMIFLIWSLDPVKNVGGFSFQQKKYLEFHRDVIFKKSFSH